MANFTPEEILAKVAAGERLEGDELRGAVLSARDDLSGANLTGANLQFISLRGFNLSRADLSGANLILVHLNGANLSGPNLQGATYTAFSKWPEGFDPEAAGAVLVED